MSGDPQIPLEHLPVAELIRRHERARASNDRDLALRIQWVLGDRLRPKVKFYLRRRVSEAEVDDLVSAVVIAAGRTMFRGDDLGAFVGWLRTIARNKLCSHYRQRSCRPQSGGVDPADVDLRDELGSPSAQDPAEAVELKLEMDGALGLLRPDHRRVIELLLLEGYSAEEVAARVDGITATNVYKIASRFRKQFKNRWNAA